MSFGEKNNFDYMTNLCTAYFTVKKDGRIIAQSVVVDAIDDNGNDLVILDNIEVANNYKNLSKIFYAKIKI